jgi:prevent-host-death family protein
MPSTLKLETNIYEAKTKLSQLVDRAMKGEVVIIAKAGKPMVKLVRVDAPAKRTLGSAAGTISYKEGWDEPMSDSEFNELVGG